MEKSTGNLHLAECFVSVVVITYNHEKYIRQCLDSILMQSVDFYFEIVISDDCSTDQTVEIIKEYQKKYPNIIKPILRSLNVGATKNQYDCFLRCTGNYVAILDGDDFWTDKEKLKTQINFLENNKTYIACTQRYSVVDENNKITQKTYHGPGRPEIGALNWSSSIAKKNLIIDRINFLKKLELYCHDEMKREIKHEDRMPYYVWWSILYMLRYPTSHNWESLKTIYRMSLYNKRVYKYIFLKSLKLPILIARQLKKEFFNK